MHRQVPLLVDGLDRHEAHLRPAGSFADGSGVVRIVLTALAGHAVRRDEVAGNEPHVNAQQAQSAPDMVRTAAGFHRDQAAGGQFGAPSEEAICRQRLGHDDAARPVDRVHLVQPLRQVDSDSRHRRH